MHLDRIKEDCRLAINTNTSLWARDSASGASLLPPRSIVDFLCVNDCSGHGQCSKGENTPRPCVFPPNPIWGEGTTGAGCLAAGQDVIVPSLFPLVHLSLESSFVYVLQVLILILHIFGSVRSSRSHNLSSFVCSVQTCLELSIFIILAYLGLS